jgi:hypothetical protein
MESTYFDLFLYFLSFLHKFGVYLHRKTLCPCLLYLKIVSIFSFAYLSRELFVFYIQLLENFIVFLFVFLERDE